MREDIAVSYPYTACNLKPYQNPYQNEPEKQQNRVVHNESTTLLKPLE